MYLLKVDSQAYNPQALRILGQEDLGFKICLADRKPISKAS